MQQEIKTLIDEGQGEVEVKEKEIYEKKKSVCKNICVVANLLSPTVCQKMIKLVNEQPLESLLTRQCLEFSSPELAEWLWQKLSPEFPYEECTDAFGEKWRAMSLNPQFEIERYQVGDRFSQHENGIIYSHYNQRSFASVIIYLNTVDTQSGGATHFSSFNLFVQPTVGTGLIFLAEGLLHGEQPIVNRNTVKYTLCTDVMYGCPWFKNDALRREIFAAYKEATNIALDMSDEVTKTKNANWAAGEMAWEKYYNLMHKLKAFNSSQ